MSTKKVSSKVMLTVSEIQKKKIIYSLKYGPFSAIHFETLSATLFFSLNTHVVYKQGSKEMTIIKRRDAGDDNDTHQPLRLPLD